MASKLGRNFQRTIFFWAGRRAFFDEEAIMFFLAAWGNGAQVFRTRILWRHAFGGKDVGLCMYDNL